MKSPIILSASKDTPLPPGEFQLLYADPPWATTLWSGDHRTPTQKRGEDHYAVLTLD